MSGPGQLVERWVWWTAGGRLDFSNELAAEAFEVLLRWPARPVLRVPSVWGDIRPGDLVLTLPEGRDRPSDDARLGDLPGRLGWALDVGDDFVRLDGKHQMDQRDLGRLMYCHLLDLLEYSPGLTDGEAAVLAERRRQVEGREVAPAVGEVRWIPPHSLDADVTLRIGERPSRGNLIKAAALLLAEIERLHREEEDDG